MANTQQIQSISTVRGLTSVSPSTADPSQTFSVVPSVKPEVISTSASHGLADAVLSAFGFQPAQVIQGASIARTGKSSLQLHRTMSILPSSRPVLTIASVETVPSSIVLGGSVIAAGGSAVNIMGESVSLDRSGGLAIGPSTTIALASVVNHESAMPSSELQPMLAIGSRTFALSIPALTDVAPPTTTFSSLPIQTGSSGFDIGGMPLNTSSPATVSDLPITIGSSNLIIGSSTIPLPALYSVYGNTGQIPTIVPSVLYVDDTSISAYQPGVTIDGTSVSLGSSGLVIGSQTIPLLRPSLFALSEQTTTIGTGHSSSAHLVYSGLDIFPVYTAKGYTFTAGQQVGQLSTPILSVGGIGAILVSAFDPGRASQTAGSSTPMVAESGGLFSVGVAPGNFTTLSSNATVDGGPTNLPGASSSKSHAAVTGKGAHPVVSCSIAVVLSLWCIVAESYAF